MKRWLAALLLLLCTLAVLPAGAARADGGDPEFLPPQLKGTVDNTLSFNRYPVWAYTVDGDGGFMSDGGRNTLNGINQWMAYKAWAVKASIRLMHYPMQLQPGHLLADEASTITGGLTSGLWNDSTGGLVNAGLLLGGLLALLATALRGLGSGFRTLGRTAGLLVLTTGLLLNLSPLLRGVDDVTGQLANSTFGLVNPDGETAIDKFGDAAWQTLVLNPWIQGEFGSMDVAKRYTANNTPGGIFLNLTPYDRTNRFSSQMYSNNWGYGPDFKWWGLDYVTPRQVLAGVTAVLATPVALAGVLLAGGWLVYQVLALLIFAGTPILLLLALWLPDRGYALLQRWMMRLFALVVLQIVFAFLLGGFVRLGLVASGVDMITWMGQAVLLTLVSVAVLLTRREWLAIMGAVVNPAGAPRQGLAGRVGAAVRTVVQRVQGGDASAAATVPVRASLATVPVRIESPAQASNAFASAPVAAADGPRSAPEPERQSIIQQRSESVQLIQRASGFAAVGDLSPGRGEGDSGSPQPTKGPAQDASARALGRLRNRDES